MLHPVSLVENASLLRSRVFDELVQFSIDIAEGRVPFLRVTSAIFGNLEILAQRDAQVLPARQLREMRAVHPIEQVREFLPLCVQPEIERRAKFTTRIR